MPFFLWFDEGLLVALYHGCIGRGVDEWCLFPAMDRFFLLLSMRFHPILFVQSMRIFCRFVVVRFLLYNSHVTGRMNFVSASYRVFATYPVLRCTCFVWSTSSVGSVHTCTCSCTFLVLIHLLRCFVLFLVRWTGARRTRIRLPRTHGPRGGALRGVGNPIDTFGSFLPCLSPNGSVRPMEGGTPSDDLLRFNAPLSKERGW